MRIFHRYMMSVDEELLAQLASIGINAKICPDINRMVFDIYEDQANWEELNQICREEPVFSELRYSTEEITQSAWLMVRSTNNTKLEAKDVEKTYSGSCKVHLGGWLGDGYRHYTQIGPFHFSKNVKWGKNCFLSCIAGGFWVLFCNSRTKHMLEESELNGLSFMPVRQYKKSELLDDMYQVVFDNLIDDEYLMIDGPYKRSECELCGQVHYQLSWKTRIMVDGAALGTADFYTTNNIFGPGLESSPRLIISHKAYLFLTENRMARNLEFVPLDTFCH